jgi:hypothetical protein
VVEIKVAGKILPPVKKHTVSIIPATPFISYPSTVFEKLSIICNVIIDTSR